MILLKRCPVLICCSAAETQLLCFYFHSSTRSVSSSQHGSQAAALSKLAQIESRVRSRMQVQDHGPAESVASNMGAASPSQEAPVRLSAQSSSEQSRGGKHFLKNKTAGAAGSPDVGVRSRSRAAEFAGPAAGLDRKPVRGVSLESDEEDMRKLLGESLDSEDHSFLAPVRASSLRTADKVLSAWCPLPLSTALHVLDKHGLYCNFHGPRDHLCQMTGSQGPVNKQTLHSSDNQNIQEHLGMN